MTIYAMVGAAGAGKDELFRQAELLAPDRVARVALGDEIKYQSNGACLSRYQISAWTEDPDAKARIRPFLEEFGRNHGPQLLPMVIARALRYESEGKVVFVPRVQNAREMRDWLIIGALPVMVIRPGVAPATTQEALDIDSIVRMQVPMCTLVAADLDQVQRNARALLGLAGVQP
ncbi:hypothetical protein [Deinococcus fonticola]|uniref:hypothetical protein n=1 Tax=Deinococcus fonticola TaxID=2528713 RepID=UPI00107584E0|nr:hypothetical protein [Deinococcus fonticola]